MKDRRLTRSERQLEVTSIDLQQAARHVFLSSPEGERILDHILDTFCAVDAPTNVQDAMTLAYRAGARDVGVRIKALVHADLKGNKQQ